MTTLRRSSISWPLLAVAAGALTLTACKKSPDSKPPEPGSDGGEISHQGDNGGDASEDPSESGPDFLTVDAFEEVVGQKTSDVTDCFAAAKANKPDLGGKLMLEFTIDGTGKVREVKAESGSSINDAGLNTCVSDKAKAWQFPKTRDGQPMTLPYTFNMS